METKAARSARILDQAEADGTGQDNAPREDGEAERNNADDLGCADYLLRKAGKSRGDDERSDCGENNTV